MKTIKVLLCLACVLLIFGCSGRDGGEMTLDDSLSLLKDASFRGHVSASFGGPPSVGTSTTFFIGPPQANISFDGDVDFTRKTETE